MEFFEQQTAQVYGDESVLIISDGAGSHQQDTISTSSTMRVKLEILPAACPELNPAERFFEQLRTELSNEVFTEIEALEDFLCQILQKYFDQPELVSSLTQFPYIRRD